MYYSGREIADICEMSVQKASAMLMQLYYEGKAGRQERKVKNSAGIFIHIRVYCSNELKSLAELVKEKEKEYNTSRRQSIKRIEVPFAPIICKCCGAPVNSKTYICDYCGAHYVKASSL